MSDLRYKDCHCHTCDKDFHHMGIARHRSAHRDKKENCEITFSTGRRLLYQFAPEEADDPTVPQQHPDNGGLT